MKRAARQHSFGRGTPARRVAAVLLGSLFSLASLASLAWTGAAFAATSSADELVRQAREHEAAREDDVALRRYVEALTIDPSHEDAWMGLGALRMKLGDAAEADRVYSSALDHVPTLRRALAARARARWAMGRHADAENDLETYATLENDTAALRELADWFGRDGRTPAQLATWRRLLAIATREGDAEAAKDARRVVRALVILVDSADPASSPADRDAVRRGMAMVAKRGG